MIAAGYHTPVMLHEVLEYLKIERGDIVVDVTLGGAGHAKEFLKRISNEGTFIGIDRDVDAIEEAKSSIGSCENVKIIHSRMGDIKKTLCDLGIERVDRIFADLGVSSHQLDTVERGFSFRGDAPLDMRMDSSSGESAAELLSRLDEHELAKILIELGEERYSKRIARVIVENGGASTTDELVNLIERAVPRHAKRQKIHPATRTFQALRIAVNGELDELRIFLDSAPELLSPNGRIAVIAYHSLEDRLVKRAFREFASSGEYLLPKRKAIKSCDDEIEKNPRARSARLRVLERN